MYYRAVRQTEAVKILQNMDCGLVNINTIKEWRLLKFQNNLNKKEAWNNHHARTDLKSITPCPPGTGFTVEYIIYHFYYAIW